MNLTHFKFYRKEDVLAHTRLRKFETRIGEVVQTMQPDLSLQKELDQSTASYVLFGIPEAIGVHGNQDQEYAGDGWDAFLRAFLNSQSNDFLEGEEVLLLGHFDFADMEQLVSKMAINEEERLGAYRHAVNAIDDAVEGLVKAIVVSGKIPIVIGGGHNNAYPCIKGAAKGLHQAGMIPIPQINCINLNSHAGYQPEEGRHSGNPYRYADEDGFLEKYCVVGLQETCLQQNVWMDIVNNPFMDCITFEDVFVRGKRSFMQSIEHAAGFTSDNYTGIDLNMRIIQHNAAHTTSGISPTHARQYLNIAGTAARPAYLFISEGSASNAHLLSYLVIDFIKAMEEVDD